MRGVAARLPQDSVTATGPAVARSRPTAPCRSSAPATAGSYAERRITARSPGVSQSEGERSADRRAASIVDISCRSTAAAPRLPPPAARIARPAVLMSSEIEIVLAWRSPAGPARSTSSPYVVDAHVSARLPCCSHQSARPLPESGSVRSMTWSEARRPERQAVASTRPQLTTRRSCSAGSSSTKAGWETPTIAVRVAACGSWTMTAPVSGSTHWRSRAASPGSASVPAGRGLTTRRRYSSWPPVERQSQRAPIGPHSTIFRPPTPTNAKCDEDEDDRERHHHGADVQAEDQGACGEARHHELRTRQPE